MLSVSVCRPPARPVVLGGILPEWRRGSSRRRRSRAASDRADAPSSHKNIFDVAANTTPRVSPSSNSTKVAMPRSSESSVVDRRSCLHRAGQPRAPRNPSRRATIASRLPPNLRAESPRIRRARVRVSMRAQRLDRLGIYATIDLVSAFSDGAARRCLRRAASPRFPRLPSCPGYRPDMTKDVFRLDRVYLVHHLRRLLVAVLRPHGDVAADDAAVLVALARRTLRTASPSRFRLWLRRRPRQVLAAVCPRRPPRRPGGEGLERATLGRRFDHRRRQSSRSP